MSSKKDSEEMSIYAMADKFIALANDLVETQDVGRIGTAMRYATARFNAHEAALKTEDLEKEKGEALEWFSAQFKTMLIENLDVHVEQQKMNNQPLN